MIFQVKQGLGDVKSYFRLTSDNLAVFARSSSNLLHAFWSRC